MSYQTYNLNICIKLEVYKKLVRLAGLANLLRNGESRRCLSVVSRPY